MSDPPHLLRSSRIPSGQSPTRNRLSDDILAHLGPSSAVDALTSATGALRTCLSSSSVDERDFAMRCAVASKTIWEWVNELQDWPWPSEGGPGGFKVPRTTSAREPTETVQTEKEDDTYTGSLLTEDVTKYESRVAEIQRAFDNLSIEEIKMHVLSNHIMPLSRPGTPLPDSGRRGLAATYNKMEDISAVITAIVMRALPNLAKLSRLLQIWSLRLTVLRRVPPLLLAIEDAEVALQSGWNAISLPSKESKDLQQPTVTKKDFDVMKSVLENKISRPGRTLDFMLDCLEGLGDTLPDEWLDRMEAVEQGYADWVAVCERKMREAEWAKTARSRPTKNLWEQDFVGESEVDNSANGEERMKSDNTEGRTIGTRQVSGTSEAETIVPASPTKGAPLDNSFDSQADVSLDRTGEGESSTASTQPNTPTSGEYPYIENTSASPITPNHSFSTNNENTGDTPISITGDGSPELPPLPLRHMTSQDSVVSQASTILHGTSSHFGGLSSDMPEVSASPVLPRSRIREAEYLKASPPSSPPIPGGESRESSVTPFDSPLLAPRTHDDDFGVVPNTSFDDSFADDFDDSISFSEITSPFNRRDSTGDQHLRQQISQIIESIPAKIKLQNEPPAINLNPPDLQLPRLRNRPSVEPFKRSTSSLSSRAGTPSFTLSPAKNARLRSRGQQEIKVYHLSRSTGEAPIKLFIRCVGEQGERVMVRVGGGWADLGEYLKEYASHHKRRSAGAQNAQVEVRDLPHVPVTRGTNIGSSPPSRPASALELSPMTPLTVRKTRRSVGAMSSEAPRLLPRTPVLPPPVRDEGPSSEESNRSRSSSRLSWAEDDSSFLGLAGPSGKRVEMSAENKAWVESVKEKVRIASGERKVSAPDDLRRFGELGKVGGTKRLFRKSEGPAVAPKKSTNNNNNNNKDL